MNILKWCQIVSLKFAAETEWRVLVDDDKSSVMCSWCGTAKFFVTSELFADICLCSWRVLIIVSGDPERQHGGSKDTCWEFYSTEESIVELSANERSHWRCSSSCANRHHHKTGSSSTYWTFMSLPLISAGGIMFLGSVSVCVGLWVCAWIRPFTVVCPEWMELC